MKRLKNISLFKIAIALLLSFLLPNSLIIILLCLYLLISHRYNLLIYLLLIIILAIRFTFPLLIPVGMIRKINNQTNVCLFFYCNEINNHQYDENDLIYYKFKENDEPISINQKKNNIFSSGEITHDYKIVHIYKLSSLLLNKIKDRESKTYLKRFLFQLNDYDELNEYAFYFGFGYLILLKYLIKKKYLKLASLSLLFQYLLFGFNTTLLILFLNIVALNLELKGKESFTFVLLTIIFINPYYLYRKNIILILLYMFLSFYRSNLSYLLWNMIIQSFLFSYIDFIRLFFVKYLKFISVLIYLFSLITLFFDFLDPYYLGFLDNIFKLISKTNFILRGQINLLSIFIIIVVIYLFNINKKSFQFILFTIIYLLNFFKPLCSLNFVDIGQGDAIYFEDHANHINFLLDTGDAYNYYKLKKFLYGKGVKTIDYLIITHNDSDHNGNEDNLKKDFMINEIIKEPKDIKINSFYLQSFYCNEYENDNANSLIYGLKINDYAFLFTGDINKEVEKDFINLYGPIHFDVLKVAHHGSFTSTSTNFLDEINPQYAIISTNGKYNHPHQEVLKRLKEREINILVTNNEGDISFIFYNHKMFIKTNKAFILNP